MERRTVLGLFAVGVASLVAAGADALRSGAATTDPGLGNAAPATGSYTRLFPTATASASPVGSLTPPWGNTPVVLSQALNPTPGMALTIDDGYDQETVSAYVEFATATGMHLTFSPNAIYADRWAQHVAALQPLIAAGQVQIGNHTHSHADLTLLDEWGIRAEVEGNEQWINSMFGTSSMPYLRPPYGRYNESVRAVAAESGFTATLLWNGTLGDSALLTPDVLLQQANRYLRPGAVVLGHANHPTVTHLFTELLAIIRERAITPQTLDELFGTSRPEVPPQASISRTPSY